MATPDPAKSTENAVGLILVLIIVLSMIPGLSLSLWFIGGPLLFVAFVLSIVVMAQGRAGMGCFAMLFTITAGPLIIAFAPVISTLMFGAAMVSSAPSVNTSPVRQPKSQSVEQSDSNQVPQEPEPQPYQYPFSPRYVRLKYPVRIGDAKASVTLPSGTELMAVGEDGQTLFVQYGAQKVSVAKSLTDF